jgi:hypothetical protein
VSLYGNRYRELGLGIGLGLGIVGTVLQIAILFSLQDGPAYNICLKLMQLN